MRKWGGEKYVLHIDAMTVVNKGWDEILVSELERCGDDKRVLTAAPLGYELKTQPVVEEETFRQMYQTDVYGTIKDRLPAEHANNEKERSHEQQHDQRPPMPLLFPEQ